MCCCTWNRKTCSPWRRQVQQSSDEYVPLIMMGLFPCPVAFLRGRGSQVLWCPVTQITETSYFCLSLLSIKSLKLESWTYTPRQHDGPSFFSSFLFHHCPRIPLICQRIPLFNKVSAISDSLPPLSLIFHCLSCSKYIWICKPREDHSKCGPWTRNASIPKILLG